MKLTCVTATFNAIKAGNRERLVRCVESVAKLSTEHEHLIYDGASTDGTAELLRELEAKTPGLKVVSEPDTGIYNALNKGVCDAKGEWFYVLGCDDYLCDPAEMDSLLNTTSESDVIVAPVRRDSANKLYRGSRDLACILWSFPYSHQGVVMKTDLVRKFGGFDERFKICADWDMQMKCHRAAVAFRYVTKEFAFYSAGGASEQGHCKDQDVIHCEDLQADMRAFKAFKFPVGVVARRLFHRDYAFRLSARTYVYMRARRIAYLIKESIKSMICAGRNYA